MKHAEYAMSSAIRPIYENVLENLFSCDQLGADASSEAYSIVSCPHRLLQQHIVPRVDLNLMLHLFTLSGS